MAEFPVEPQMARMLIASGEMKCSEEVMTIAAMLSVPSIFLFPSSQIARRTAEVEKAKFAVREGDHLTLLNVFNSFMLNNKNPQWCHDRYLNYKALKKAVEVRRQLNKYLVRFKIPVASCEGKTEAIRKAIVSGFFANAAQIQPNGSYKPVRGSQELWIHPGSSLYNAAPKWVVFHEVVFTTKNFMRELTVIDPFWLSELAPQFYEYQSASHGIKRAAEQEQAQASQQSKKTRHLF